MTPEKQRIAVLELMGWKGPRHPDNLAGMDGWYSQDKEVWWVTPNGDRVMNFDVPDCLNDLNACYEFTAHMTYDQQVEFAEILHSIVLENPYKAWWNPTPHETFQLLDASAAQRCEAFLKVFDKWESQP